VHAEHTRPTLGDARLWPATAANDASQGERTVMTARSPVVHVKRAAYDVYVGRPSPFGNPFVIGRDGDRAAVVARYRAWLLAQPALVERVRRDLAGKVLGCWCAPLPCHGDVLADIAAGENARESAGVP
jgi:Domain of unknown function (DUF4326)